MTRLDSLSLKELDKLYRRSRFLSLGGKLLLFFVALLIGWAIYSRSSTTLVRCILWSFFLLPTSYVFMRGRSCREGSILRLLTGLGLILSVGYAYFFLLALLMLLPWVEVGRAAASIVLLTLALYFLINIWLAACTELLFEPEGFSHQQIVYARQKRRSGENFTDEELPPAVLSATPFVKLCAVLACLGFPADVAGVIFLLPKILAFLRFL